MTDKTNKKDIRRAVIPFLNEFNDIPITRIDDMLETLLDYGCLSDLGISLKIGIWTLFIKGVKTNGQLHKTKEKRV